MNRADYLDPALCWTGCKNTGQGIFIQHSYHNLTQAKSYHFKRHNAYGDFGKLALPNRHSFWRRA